LCKGKNISYGSFYKNEWFLDSDASTHFTLFESGFVDITTGNYSQVKIANSRVPLFIIAFKTVLIEHEIFNSKKETTKVAVSKIWPLYCVSDIQIYLFIKSRTTFIVFYSQSRLKNLFSKDKFGNAVLLVVSNLWDNIKIVKTYILKYNIFSPVSLTTRYLDFETLYYHFEHVSDEVIHHILDNIEDTKKSCFPTQKYVFYSYILRKVVFLRTLFTPLSL